MKKAILLASYGVAQHTAWEKSMGRLEEEVCKAWPDWTVISAFTGRRIIEKWREQGLAMMNEREALQWLSEQGFGRVVVIPTHLIDGSEYEKLCEAIAELGDSFESLVLGKPLLETELQREQAAQAILREVAVAGDETLVVIGHGSETAESDAYGMLEKVFVRLCDRKVIVDTLKGIGDRFSEITTQKVNVVPLLLTAGKHTLKDIAGLQENSIGSKLQKNGFEVKITEKGLGEYVSIRQVYREQLKQLINTVI